MKNKYITIIPTVIIITIILYKTGLLLYYKDLNKYSYSLESIDYSTKKIEVDKTLANTKYKNMNLYIPKEFSNIVESDTSKYYYLKNEDSNNYTLFLSIENGPFRIDSDIKEDKRLQTMNYKQVMKKNNIKSSYDLVKYYLRNNSVNYLSNSNEIKMYYLSRRCAYDIIGYDSASYTFLEGKLDGLYVKENNNTLLQIYNENDNKYYYVSIYRNTKNKSYNKEINASEEAKIINSIYFNSK